MLDRILYKGFSAIMCLCWIILTLTVSSGLAGKIEANQEKHIFSTWEGFCPDKFASIWLIQRFIDTDAVIKILPKGEIISEGTSFDVPDAEFRRYAQMSTYESLLNHYKLTDAKLVYIGRIIHDIEINIWERKVMPETMKVTESIYNIIQGTESTMKAIEQGNKFFDNLYKELEQKPNMAK